MLGVQLGLLDHSPARCSRSSPAINSAFIIPLTKKATIKPELPARRRFLHSRSARNY